MDHISDTELLEYTPEGYARAAQALDFLPEDQREAALAAVLQTLMMPV